MIANLISIQAARRGDARRWTYIGQGAIRIQILISVLCCVLFCTQSSAFEFSVSGEFKLHVAREHSGQKSEIGGSYNVTWKDCEWIIRSQGFDEGIDFQEDGYDGRYIYSFSSFETMVNKMRQQGKTVGVNIGESIITHGSIPYNTDEINKILWLMYASSCDFSKTTTNRFPPVVSLSSRKAYLYNYEQRADWRVSDQLPHLPLFMIFYSNGRFLHWNDEDAGYMAGPPTESKWDAPYDNGFTNSILNVERFYHENGYQIPKMASFQVYAPRTIGGLNSNDVELLRSYSFHATNIMFDVAIVDFKPKIPGVAS